MIDYEVITNPDEVLYEEVKQFTIDYASGDRACDPEKRQKTYVHLEHVRNGHYFLMLGRSQVDATIVSVFWVDARTGEAVLPAYRDEYADYAIALGVMEAQKHCPIQLWCTPYNPKNAEWILATGWADKKRWEEEGIITWSPQL